MKFPPHVAQPPLRRRARNRGASLATALVAALFSALVAAGCSDGGARQPRVGPPPPETPLAAGTIGPAGGSIAVTEGPHAGVALTIAAGSVGSDSNFTIWLDRGESEVPSVF